MLTKLQVKYIQSLNEKKFRKQEGLFIAEGPKIVTELLDNPHIEPVALYGTREWWQQEDVSKKITDIAKMHEISMNELQKISMLSAPNRVLGLFRFPVFPEAVNFKKRISLVLDGIQDPGNMGTIIRIADWYGIKHVIASNDSADVFNPKVVQSTMGSITRVQVLYKDLLPFLSDHVAIPLFASTLHGQPLGTFKHVQEGFLLVGNESKGVRKELLKLAAHQLTIPKLGNAESLNAAVATGIILSHIL